MFELPLRPRKQTIHALKTRTTQRTRKKEKEKTLEETQPTRSQRIQRPSERLGTYIKSTATDQRDLLKNDDLTETIANQRGVATVTQSGLADSVARAAMDTRAAPPAQTNKFFVKDGAAGVATVA